MDYMSVLEHAREVCQETFPSHAGDISILYMCQTSQVRILRCFGHRMYLECRTVCICQNIIARKVCKVLLCGFPVADPPSKSNNAANGGIRRDHCMPPAREREAPQGAQPELA